MHFYQIKKPFFTLIAADSKEKCVEIYLKQVISNYKDNITLSAIKEIDRNQAIVEIANAYLRKTKELVGLQRATSQIFELINYGHSKLLIKGRECFLI